MSEEEKNNNQEEAAEVKETVEENVE